MQHTTISTCPFCNAKLSSSSATTCNRCGEAIPQTSRGAGVEAGSELGLASPVASQRTLRQKKAVRSLRIALIVGVIFGLTGFTASIISKRFFTTKVEPPAVDAGAPVALEVVAPLEMPVLKWLPDGTDTVIALQAASLRESFGNENPQTVSQLLTKAGIPDNLRIIIEKMIPAPLEEVEHLALGLNAKSGILLSDWVAVVQFRKPYRIESLAERAKAEELQTSKAGRKLYFAKVPELKLAVGTYWWPASDRVLVATLNSDVMTKNVPEKPRDTIKHLNPKLTERVATLMPSDSYGWGYSQSEKYESLLGLVLGFFDRKELAKPVGEFRMFALSIRNDNGLVLTTWAEAKSEKRAVAVREWLETNIVQKDDSASVGGAGPTVMLRIVSRGTNTVEALEKIFAK